MLLLIALLSSFESLFSETKKQKNVFAEIWLLRLLFKTYYNFPLGIIVYLYRLNFY